jgi:hypothetical protein
MAKYSEALLRKALEAGSYDVTPSLSIQGSSLQRENLDAVMKSVTFDDKHFVLQQVLESEVCKSTTPQFTRTLSVGNMSSAAQYEGGVGEEDTGDYARIVVPMAYYAQVRKVTLVADMVETFDGVKNSDREAMASAKIIAGNVELDLFRGKADFSNAGAFDGNPLSIAAIPNMLGLDPQIRMAESERTAQDASLQAYGSQGTNLVTVGGTVSQTNVANLSTRTTMAFGNPTHLYLDPYSLQQYNLNLYTSNQRFVWGGQAPDATGTDLRRQLVSDGQIQLTSCRFLAGRTGINPTRSGAPAVPASASGSASGTDGSIAAGTYIYRVSAVNERGESALTTSAGVSVSATNHVALTIGAPASGTYRYFNVFRTAAGGAAATAKFIGRVIAAASGNTTFTDLGSVSPGFVTGFMVQHDSMAIKEMHPYARMKLAVPALYTPEACFRFCCLAVYQPRFNGLLLNITGS